MLMPAEQRRYGIDIGQVRSNNQRRHRQAGFALEAHLAKHGTGERMGQVIHATAIVPNRMKRT